MQNTHSGSDSHHNGSTGLNAALFLNGLCALEGTTASGNNNNGHLTLDVLVYFCTANAIVIYCIATLIPLTVMHLFHNRKSNIVTQREKHSIFST